MDNAADIARIAAAQVQAVTEAKAMVDAGQFGQGLADLVQHGRELHQLIGEELAATGASVGEHAGGLYAAMTERLKELEGLLRLDVQQH
jgi:hypothetical protein